MPNRSKRHDCHGVLGIQIITSSNGPGVIPLACHNDNHQTTASLKVILGEVTRLRDSWKQLTLLSGSIKMCMINFLFVLQYELTRQGWGGDIILGAGGYDYFGIYLSWSNSKNGFHGDGSILMFIIYLTNRKMWSSLKLCENKHMLINIMFWSTFGGIWL